MKYFSWSLEILTKISWIFKKYFKVKHFIMHLYLQHGDMV